MRGQPLSGQRASERSSDRPTRASGREVHDRVCACRRGNAPLLQRQPAVPTSADREGDDASPSASDCEPECRGGAGWPCLQAQRQALAGRAAAFAAPVAPCLVFGRSRAAERFPRPRGGKATTAAAISPHGARTRSKSTRSRVAGPNGRPPGSALQLDHLRCRAVRSGSAALPTGRSAMDMSSSCGALRLASAPAPPGRRTISDNGRKHG